MTLAFDPYLVLDIETDSINPFTCKIDRIGFLWQGVCDEISFRKRSSYVKQEALFRKLLADPKVSLVAHNAAFDLQVLRQNGFEFSGPLHDTMLLMKALRTDFPSYALKPLNYMIFGDPCLEDMKLETWFKEHSFKISDRDMTKAPNHLVRNYCQADVMMTERLFLYGLPLLGRQEFLYEVEMETLKVLLKIEKEKIYVDRKFCKAASYRRKRRSREIETGLRFNPRSTRQLGSRLEDAGYEVEKTAKGNITTDEKHLMLYRKQKDTELIKNVFRIRKLTKDQGTYLKNLLDATSKEHPYFYPHFNQSLAVTRRFSSSGFYGVAGQITRGNMQNFPKHIRRAIIPPPGYLVASIDMSQIEPRMLAHLIEKYLGYSEFADCYRLDPDYNLYVHVARMARRRIVKKKSKLYDKFKATVLALAYGSGINRTAEQLGISASEAKKLRDEVHRVRPQIKLIQMYMTEVALRKGRIVDTFGAVYDIMPGEEYKAVNAFCQGCSGTAFKYWLIEYGKHVESFDSPDILWNLLHDEIDLYVLDDGEHEKRLEGYCNLLANLEILFGLPITASYQVGNHWGEC